MFKLITSTNWSVFWDFFPQSQLLLLWEGKTLWKVSCPWESKIWVPRSHLYLKAAFHKAVDLHIALLSFLDAQSQPCLQSRSEFLLFFSLKDIFISIKGRPIWGNYHMEIEALEMYPCQLSWSGIFWKVFEDPCRWGKWVAYLVPV